MRQAGIDIGSRTVKVVLIEDGGIRLTRKGENSFDPMAVCRTLLDGISYDRITATGYGRHLFRARYDCEVISEIRAFATGAKALFPGCRTLLDIGGQDTKVVSLDPSGRILKFEMNDKCAAGTGRFMEMMAVALGLDPSGFGEAALSTKEASRINSMCAVFAESEVISMTARGMPREEVALGIHQAVARRAAAMLARVAVEDDVVFAGGVALNPCLRKLLGNALGRTVHVPGDPQIVGALGCALSS